MFRPIERLFLISVLLLLASFGVARAPDTATAHSGDLGWIWGTNTTEGSYVDDRTNSSNGWSSAISAGVSDWYNNTRLWPSMQPISSANQHHYYDGDYGNSGWLGGANVYSGSTLCGSPNGGVTGYCNKTTVKANLAIYNLNNYYFNPWGGNYSAIYEKQRTAAHELGHAYGLSHPTCSDAALMSVTGCWYPSQPPNNGVVAHDIYHVNLLY